VLSELRRNNAQLTHPQGRVAVVNRLSRTFKRDDAARAV
jgi:hypothetical protein